MGNGARERDSASMLRVLTTATVDYESTSPILPMAVAFAFGNQRA